MVKTNVIKHKKMASKKVALVAALAAVGVSGAAFPMISHAQTTDSNNSTNTDTMANAMLKLDAHADASSNTMVKWVTDDNQERTGTVRQFAAWMNDTGSKTNENVTWMDNTGAKQEGTWTEYINELANNLDSQGMIDTSATAATSANGDVNANNSNENNEGSSNSSQNQTSGSANANVGASANLGLSGSANSSNSSDNNSDNDGGILGLNLSRLF